MSQTSASDIRAMRADIARQALQNNPEIPIVDLISLLIDSAGVKRTERSLWRIDQSTVCSVDVDVMKDCDIDRSDPDNVTSIYLRDEQIVILDFNDRL